LLLEFDGMDVFAFFLLLVLPLSQVVAQNTEYQACIHYLEIANPIEVNAKEGQSGEVLVFFKYTCPACFQLHPFVEAWETTLDTSVVVKRVPVFQPEVYSKAYYAADLLNLDDGFHQDVYKKFHQERKPLRKMEEFAQLASAYGVDANRFLSTANSFAVDMKVNQGTNTAGQAQVPGTPFILVNGKYLLSGKMVGSNARMLEVADYLLGRDGLGGSE
jgi:thiol:disulfide interchange protein DsbA